MLTDALPADVYFFNTITLLLLSQSDRLTDRQFSEMIEDMFELEEDDIESIQRDTNEIYHNFLDPDGKGFITRDGIKALSQDTLKQIVRRCEAPHGPVAGAPGDQGAAYKLRMDTKANKAKPKRENEERDEL